MKRNNTQVKTIIMTMIITIIITLSIFYAIGLSNNSEKESKINEESHELSHQTSYKEVKTNTSSSTTIEKSKSSTINSSTVKEDDKTTHSTSQQLEKHLTNQQMKEWTHGVMTEFWPRDTEINYIVEEPYLNSDDNLVYVTVSIPQTDNFGTLRVNSSGQLEGIGNFSGSLVDWVIVSKQYMELGTAKELASKRNQNLEEEAKERKQKEESYYNMIYDARDKQQQYIDSIDNEQVKQSVQTSQSAAFVEANYLISEYPEDTDIIKKALGRVVD